MHWSQPEFRASTECHIGKVLYGPNTPLSYFPSASQQTSAREPDDKAVGLEATPADILGLGRGCTVGDIFADQKRKSMDGYITLT